MHVYRLTLDSPSVVAFAEDHATSGVAGLADFCQCRAAIRALEAAIVPVPIHRQQQPSFHYLSTAAGALLNTRRRTRNSLLLQRKIRFRPVNYA